MLTLINLIDFAILIALIFAAGNGHQRGFWLSLFQYLGLLGGVVLGAAAAPAIADLLGINSPSVRPITAVIVLLALGSVGSSVRSMKCFNPGSRISLSACAGRIRHGLASGMALPIEF